jgi:2-haloalkanoic acid dehalogenase type II
MSKVPANLKVCIFDVFGTVVDWRGSLIADLPALGKKYGIETDWTSFADDWRGLYQPQMGRVRKGELPWTRIDDLHKEAFEMLLAKRGLKHPGEEGAWEFTHLWHKLRPWPDSVEGIGMMKKKYVVATLSNGNVALLINMAKNGGRQHVPQARAGDAGGGAQQRPGGGAEVRPVDRLRPAPGRTRPRPDPRPQGRGRLERGGHVDDRSREEAWVLITVVLSRRRRT